MIPLFLQSQRLEDTEVVDPDASYDGPGKKSARDFLKRKNLLQSEVDRLRNRFMFSYCCKN